jgi:hypothetical protein
MWISFIRVITIWFHGMYIYDGLPSVKDHNCNVYNRDYLLGSNGSCISVRYSRHSSVLVSDFIFDNCINYRTIN